MPATIYLEARYIGHPSETATLQCDHVEYRPPEVISRHIGADGGVMDSLSSAYIIVHGLSDFDTSTNWTHIAWTDLGTWMAIREIDLSSKPVRITVTGG